ncbi:MAG: hypothetical protein WCR95_04115, partial [Eubacteriales bacterium]
MRKLMAIILSVLLVSACFAAIGATAAQAFEVSASSPESVTPGQSYDLVITLDSMPALGSEEHVSAIIFKVGYDKDLVTFDLKQGKEADFTTTLNSGLENIVAVEDDYIDATFMDFSFGDLFAADQTVTFHFTVDESAVSNVVFDVYDVAYAIGTNMTAFIDGVGTGSVSEYVAVTLPEPYAKIDFSTGAAIDLKGKVELTNNGASFSEKEFKHG